VEGFFLLGGRFLPATGERLARRFELLVAAVVSDPERSLNRLMSAVTEAESELWSSKAEKLQATSLERLRKSSRRSVAGFRA
jgi:hypothetical protein